MSLFLDGLWNATDGRCQVGDVGSDMTITTGHDFGKFAIIVGHNKGKSV